MQGGYLTMSRKEVDRWQVIQAIVEKRLKQGIAAKQLGVTARQVRRLTRQYRAEGVPGLISKKRGQGSNNRKAKALKAELMALINRDYADFGPTLAAEKLREKHGYKVSKETLRAWMMEGGLWEGKRRKKAKIHQTRTRRPCRGELVQIDGSPHAWFEGRGEKCCLLVFIDDATSELLQLHFEKTETTAGYFKATRKYLESCGRPVAFYSDKAGIFRINRPESLGEGCTQFGRAMEDLGIEIICANSPQAKGRVERANGILQDRLVKELRLQGINDIETANAFLPVFMADYNRRFAKVPASVVDAHRRELPVAEILDVIFSEQQTRKLSKNLELSYNNTLYQIKTEGAGYRLRYTQVIVCEDTEGKVTLLHKGNALPYTSRAKEKRGSAIIGAKQLNTVLDIKRAVFKPASNHPWRRYVEPRKLREGIQQMRGETCVPAH
jgi:transposase